MASSAGVARTARSAHRPRPTRGRRALGLLRTSPNRRAAMRRGAALLVAVTVLSVAASTHRRGLELADRWGEPTRVLVLDAPVPAGELVLGHVRAVQAPSPLVPAGHVDELPPDARAATDLVDGEILTRRRLRVDGDRDPTGPGEQRALVPVPLHGREGSAPSELAAGDLVDVIGPGAPTASGGREPARTVATGAVVRSLDVAAVTLEVASRDVAGLADALLGGPVVLTVVGATGGSGARGRDVVDDE